MTLQRRVLLLLLVSAPLVWAAALLFSLDRARGEINELFDTELVRLARQMQSTLPLAALEAIEQPSPAPAADGASTATDQGHAEIEDMAIAVWNREGKLLLVDREGALLPHDPQGSGFHDMKLGGAAWRVFYLQSASGAWLVAAGQALAERDELVWDLIASQLLPWMLTLPVLLLAMAAAVRTALKPLRTLTGELDRRMADDLKPLATLDVPADLQPLVRSMNTLLERVGRTLEHERRFTADAAHELRTPLAAMQAQWDAAKLGGSGAGTEKIGLGLARLSRLVTQLLSMSRLDQLSQNEAHVPVDGHAVAGQVVNEVLPLADRRGVELAFEWPPAGTEPLRLEGDHALLVALLRNLLDNALRHSRPGTQVTLRMGSDAIEVLDEGVGVQAENLERLGDRFFRPAGEAEPGSGLGLSIVRRIAALHGLAVQWRNREDRSGFAVRLSRTAT